MIVEGPVRQSRCFHDLGNAYAFEALVSEEAAGLLDGMLVLRGSSAAR